MRHRATRNPLTLLRPRRLRPRRRASEGTAGAGTLTRPGLRLTFAVAAVLAVLTGGVVAASQLEDKEVPTSGGSGYADRAAPDEPSRSSKRIPWPAADAPSTPPTPHRSPTPAPARTNPRTPDPTKHEATPSTGDDDRTDDRLPQDLPSAQVSASAAAPDVRTPSPAPTDEPSRATPRRSSGDTTEDRQKARPPQDDTPPETTIVSGPTTTNGSALEEDSEFVFDASESASFSCSLDGQPFQPCDSPQEYDDLSPGRHKFAVRAVDAAGNVDPTPDHHSWVTAGPVAASPSGHDSPVRP